MLQFENVDFSYNGQEIFSNVSFSLNHGEFNFLIGKSGSGKSTLLQMIYMNIFPHSGEITFENYSSSSIRPKDLPLLRRKLGIVFQDFKLLKDRNVYQNLEFVLEVTNCSGVIIKKKINDALSDVGLLHKRNNFVNELSGGEKQRVAIARAILNDPILILADEPTGNLDPETSGEILEILQRINLKGTAILFATHNYELVKRSNSKVLKLENGKMLKGNIRQK